MKNLSELTPEERAAIILFWSRVQEWFKLRGTSMNQWCQINGIGRGNVSSACLGKRNGTKAIDIRILMAGLTGLELPVYPDPSRRGAPFRLVPTPADVPTVPAAVIAEGVDPRQLGLFVGEGA